MQSQVVSTTKIVHYYMEKQTANKLYLKIAKHEVVRSSS